jgi:archaetidylinositol phosphate synthase
MKDRGFKEADRAQVSFLAPMEKRVLIWMAGRTPAAINPDHLTVLGLAALIGAGFSYWYARQSKAGLILAMVCIAVNWLGDSLDGTLARYRNRQRPKYGFYVDHIVDMFGTFSLLAGMGMSGYMSERIAGTLLVLYFMLSIEVYLATYTLGTFHLSFWKFSPTELRVLLIIGNIVLLYKPVVGVFGYRFPLFDLGGAVGIAGMGLTLITSVTRHTIALYRAERIP